MKQKGAMPIPYIVALIFGVIVIALLGYWFVTQGSKTIITGEKAECDSKKYAFCLQWKNIGFNDDTKPPSLGFDTQCTIPPDKPTCEGILGSSSQTVQSICAYRTPSCLSGEVYCGDAGGARKCCKPKCP